MTFLLYRFSRRFFKAKVNFSQWRCSHWIILQEKVNLGWGWQVCSIRSDKKVKSYHQIWTIAGWSHAKMKSCATYYFPSLRYTVHQQKRLLHICYSLNPRWTFPRGKVSYSSSEEAFTCPHEEKSRIPLLVQYWHLDKHGNITVPTCSLNLYLLTIQMKIISNMVFVLQLSIYILFPNYSL